MTRILILGNSHAATLRRAFPAIGAAFPQVTLDFWGLPGAAFAKAVLGPDGILRPDPTDRISLRKLGQWNVAEQIDLAPYDRIFLIGLRLNTRALMQMLRGLQPLDWGRRSGAMAISSGFLTAAIRAEIDARLAAQAERIPMDARFTLLAAPCAAESATRPGPLNEPVTTSVARLPRTAELYDLFTTQAAAAHAARGLGFATQPAETLARPWLTRDALLEDAARDARHMNAEYGLTGFAALMAAALRRPQPETLPPAATPRRRRGAAGA